MMMVVAEKVTHPWVLAPLSLCYLSRVHLWVLSSQKPQLHPYLNHNSTAHNAQKFTFPLKYICMLLHTIA